MATQERIDYNKNYWKISEKAAILFAELENAPMNEYPENAKSSILFMMQGQAFSGKFFFECLAKWCQFEANKD